MDLGANVISEIKNLVSLNKLEDLWLNDNKIENFACFEELKSLKNLTTIYLERNPVASDFEYRKRLQEVVKSATQIDATPVKRR